VDSFGAHEAAGQLRRRSDGAWAGPARPLGPHVGPDAAPTAASSAAPWRAENTDGAGT